MKKSIIFIAPIILLLSSCGSVPAYQYEHVGIYDNNIRQYIEIGASKSAIEKLIGSGDEKTQKTGTNFVDYDDYLSVWYDENNIAYHISVYSMWATPEKNTRYELDGLNCENILTDFIDNYDYVYEFDDPYSSTYNTIAIFVENTSSGLKYVTKNELLKEREKAAKEKVMNSGRPIYKISIAYSSYDFVTSLSIDLIDAIEYDWSKCLSDNIK